MLPNTVLQPVAATIPMDSGPWTWRVAATSIRIADASPQPAQEPAPPTYPIACSPSIRSASAFSFRYSFGVGGRDRKKRMSRSKRSSVDSPVAGSSATLSIMIRASWPSAAQTSTHSAQPLQWTGSTKIPN